MANRKEELLELYRSVLCALDCSISSDGLVSFVTPHCNEPVYVVEGKRLALPTDDITRNLAHGHLAPFHPLSEVIVLGQSQVIMTLRQLVNESLTHKILSTILGIAMAVSREAKFTAKQTEYIKDLEKIDEKTVKFLSKIVESIDTGSSNRVINVFLKHGGILHDIQYKRICTVSFPLYTAVINATDTVYGVHGRKQDIRLLKVMLEKLFPNIGMQDAYSFGSNSLTAPYFHALLGGFKNVMEDLNRITSKFRKIIEEYTGTNPYVNLEFIETYGEGTDFKDIIPPLELNKGTDNSAKTPAAQMPAPPAQPQAAPIQQPVAQPVSAPVAPIQPIQQLGVAPKRNMFSGIVKSKLGSNNTTNQQTGQTFQQDNRDFAQMAYPPELYPQMQPAMQNPYPRFAANGQLVQPMGYPQQPMIPPQQVPYGYAPPQPMMPSLVPYGIATPQPMMAPPMAPPMAPMQPMPPQQVPYGYAPQQPMMPQQMPYGYAPQQPMQQGFTPKFK